ncbi:MAG: hypothetical protein V4594_16860 [Bacteroidota bacterium]
MSEQNKTPDPLADLKATVDKQSKQIDALTKKLAQPKGTEISDKAPEPPKVPSKPVSVGEKKYKWNLAVFQMPGSTAKVTAEEASTDKEMIAEILKIEGQGLLTEVV